MKTLPLLNLISTPQDSSASLWLDDRCPLGHFCSHALRSAWSTGSWGKALLEDSLEGEGAAGLFL